MYGQPSRRAVQTGSVWWEEDVPGRFERLAAWEGVTRGTPTRCCWGGVRCTTEGVAVADVLVGSSRGELQLVEVRLGEGCESIDGEGRVGVARQAAVRFTLEEKNSARRESSSLFGHAQRVTALAHRGAAPAGLPSEASPYVPAPSLFASGYVDGTLRVYAWSADARQSVEAMDVISVAPQYPYRPEASAAHPVAAIDWAPHWAEDALLAWCTGDRWHLGCLATGDASSKGLRVLQTHRLASASVSAGALSPSAGLHCVRFHPHGALLAVAGELGIPSVFDLRSGQCVMAMGMLRPTEATTGAASNTSLKAAHSGRVTALAWHPHGWHLATGGEDRTACVWDIRRSAGTLAALRETSAAVEEEVAAVPRLYGMPAHRAAISGMAFGATAGTADTQVPVLLSSALDGTLRVWQAHTYALHQTIPAGERDGHDVHVVHMDVSGWKTEAGRPACIVGCVSPLQRCLRVYGSIPQRRR
ncbi:hypothetical protein CDCA_CDCA17G4382 [Cyanidium caldarium]|uniref:Uncharacterized protein n=1 Tax=Cyanidium caldarium TaxID=2771 RepID=A0AAV9J1A3_CYACA|nr:hypothetical protein CDCA_CDCA17G4382 [Cyanidium caldarium]|eukprot:ctg_285.g194